MEYVKYIGLISLLGVLFSGITVIISGTGMAMEEYDYTARFKYEKVFKVALITVLSCMISFLICAGISIQFK